MFSTGKMSAQLSVYSKCKTHAPTGLRHMKVLKQSPYGNTLALGPVC